MHALGALAAGALCETAETSNLLPHSIRCELANLVQRINPLHVFLAQGRAGVSVISNQKLVILQAADGMEG